MTEVLTLQNIPDYYDVIIVEGYDCVGKSTTINLLKKSWDACVYHMNYNYWQDKNLPKEFRWVVGVGFLDFLSSGALIFEKPLIIDRGILSGSVYNEDYNLLRGYKELLKSTGKKILHLILRTDESSYLKFSRSRGASDVTPYSVVKEKTDKFINLAVLYGLDYIVLDNTYSESRSKEESTTCLGCAHFSGGICRHPSKNGTNVSDTDPRCDVSTDKEVQDKGV